MDRRRHSVWIVDVASCFGGAWAWRMPRSDIEGVGTITVRLRGELLVFCGIIGYLELLFSLAGQGRGRLDTVVAVVVVVHSSRDKLVIIQGGGCCRVPNYRVWGCCRDCGGGCSAGHSVLFPVSRVMTSGNRLPII